MFDAIFNCAVDAFFLADDRGRYVRVNPAAEKLTGYSNAELCAMTVFDLTPTPNKEVGLAMWREFIRQGTLSGGYSLTRKDGSLAEVEFQAVANIKPGIHLSIVNDVTARKRDERRLRRAVRLQEATGAMSASVEMAQVAEVILSVGLVALDAQAGHVVAVVERGAFAEVVATIGMPPERVEEWAENYRSVGSPPKTEGGRYRFSLDSPSALGAAFRRGGPIRLEQMVDLGPLPAKGNFGDLGAAVACLPLVVSGALVGGLYLFWKEKRSFDEDEASFAETLAGLCAQSLDRARLFTAEREARERAVASEKRILEYQERLQRMAFDRVVVEERERHRAATALHDGVTQYLALAKMTLTPLQQRLEGADRTAMDAAIKLITDAIAETRSLSFELSPPVLSVREQISRLGGTVEVTSVPNDGTRICVRVPNRPLSPSRDDGSKAARS